MGLNSRGVLRVFLAWQIDLELAVGVGGTHDHRERLLGQMHDTAVAAEQHAATQAISRAELLRRRAASPA
jgi:hypothetical protein